MGIDSSPNLLRVLSSISLSTPCHQDTPRKRFRNIFDPARTIQIDSCFVRSTFRSMTAPVQSLKTDPFEPHSIQSPPIVPEINEWVLRTENRPSWIASFKINSYFPFEGLWIRIFQLPYPITNHALHMGTSQFIHAITYRLAIMTCLPVSA